MLKGDKADSSTLSHRTLANDFRKEIRSQAKTGGKGYTKGSFEPTYGDQVLRSDTVRTQWNLQCD